ncbi:MAG: Fic family protein [Terriglobia bacterium]
MAEKLEFTTRHQFHPLIEKRDRWLRIQDQESSRGRFDQLVGPHWASQNWALQGSLQRVTSPKPSSSHHRDERLARHELAARQMVDWAQSLESLSSTHLLELHQLLSTGSSTGKSRFRENDIASICEAHEPIEAELVPAVVENALQWFQAESFHQMHEIERTALVLTKLVDIHPFGEANGITVRLISNFSLLRAGYPPAILSPLKADAYALAIENAIRFHTQPLVDLLAEAAHETLCICLGEPPPPPTLKVIG